MKVISRSSNTPQLPAITATYPREVHSTVCVSPEPSSTPSLFCSQCSAWDQHWVPGILLSYCLAFCLPSSRSVSLALSVWLVQPVTGLLACETSRGDFFFLREPDAPASYSLLFQSIRVMVLDKSEMNVTRQCFSGQLEWCFFCRLCFSSQRLIENFSTTEWLGVF